MLDAAVKALSQILSPPMRSILWRSIGLAMVLIVVSAVGVWRLWSWCGGYGEGPLIAVLVMFWLLYHVLPFVLGRGLFGSGVGWRGGGCWLVGGAGCFVKRKWAGAMGNGLPDRDGLSYQRQLAVSRQPR